MARARIAASRVAIAYVHRHDLLAQQGSQIRRERCDFLAVVRRDAAKLGALHRPRHELGTEPHHRLTVEIRAAQALDERLHPVALIS